MKRQKNGRKIDCMIDELCLRLWTDMWSGTL